jgi:dihydrofolate reductase
MGSATYEWMQRHLCKPGADTAASWPYSQPTWVFSSRRLAPWEGADLRFVEGDVRPVHAQMQQAAAGRNVWVVGGGGLVGQFYDAGLLDEIIVQVSSVTLGAGKPLLPRRITNPPLRLMSVEQFGPGFAELRYEVPNVRQHVYHRGVAVERSATSRAGRAGLSSNESLRSSGHG